MGVEPFDKVQVDISVVVGSATLPIHQLLRMGRGALIALDAGEDDDVHILANDTPIARGRVLLAGDRIRVSVTQVLARSTATGSRGTVEIVG